MISRRAILFPWTAALLAVGCGSPRPQDEPPDWRVHPALVEPDGQSHRGDKMVAAGVDDPRVLEELSRRFKSSENDFEKRQEYLLRLLDYYLWGKNPEHSNTDNRLLGMSIAQVEAVFGPGNPGAQLTDRTDSLFWRGGRDLLVVYFEDGRISYAVYIMGY